jgi:hypothetical protein
LVLPYHLVHPVPPIGRGVRHDDRVHTAALDRPVHCQTRPQSHPDAADPPNSPYVLQNADRFGDVLAPQVGVAIDVLACRIAASGVVESDDVKTGVGQSAGKQHV